MSDDKLRLEAEVRDNMSPALRKIKNELASIRVSPGMDASTGWIKKLGSEAEKFATKGASVAGVMGAIGIGGLATAGSLAAVVAQMKELGDRSLAMKELGRETGVSTDFLNAWSHAGLNFGVTSDSMQSAITHLTDQMPQFKRSFGSLFNLMAQRWPNLTEKLKTEDTAHQVHDIIEQFDKLKNEPQLQKQLLSEAFGNGSDMEKLMRNGAKGFFEEFARQQKALNPINPELTKQAQAFREATTQFNDALTNFENKTGPAFLKGMTAIVNESEHFVDALGKLDDKKTDEKTVGGREGALIRDYANPFALSPPEKWAVEKFQKGLHWLAEPWQSAPSTSKPADKAGAFQGQNANPLLHKSAFITGGDFDGMGAIATGTKSGVLAAFRELMATGDAGLPATTGVPKFTRASYETSNPAAAAGRAIGLRDGARNEGTPYHDSNAFYDAIIQSEGTAKHGDPYNTSLGYLKSPKPLTEMTNEEVLKWGDYIRHNTRIGEPTNSSAKGAFQIVNTTQRAAMKALGIAMSDLFSIENQRRMASWIAKKQGLNAWTSLPLHPKLEARAYRALRDGAANAGRRATGLSDNGAVAGRAATGPQGTIRADIHVHGNPHKTMIKSTGQIEASLHRWPKAEMEV